MTGRRAVAVPVSGLATVSIPGPDVPDPELPVSTTPITTGKVVFFHYTLTDADGEVIDSSEGMEPMPYLHGAENIVPGLERQMEGRLVGDRFTAVVPPEEGYGEVEGPGPQTIPRDAFPEDAELEEGMQFAAQDEEGNEMPLWVVSVEDDVVIVDQNHPLAGVTLHFQVEIVDMRDATEVEIAHGHPHGTHVDFGEHDCEDDEEDEGGEDEAQA